MKNLLLIGPISDATGYSKACIEYALSLDLTGVNVVCRSVKMTNTTDNELPEKIKEFHTKPLSNIDIVFQYNLPNTIVYKGSVENWIGFCYETTGGFPNSDWETNLKMMDRIISPCQFQHDNLPESIKNKSVVIPIPTDGNKYEIPYEKMEFGLPKNTLIFYNIGEFNRRKNIPSLLVAYSTAFDSGDNVALILKTNNPNAVKEALNDIRKGLNKFSNVEKYPKVIIVGERLSDSNLMSLHSTGDIYISASHGESADLPMIDALGKGNCVIAPNGSVYKERLEGQGGVLVECSQSVCFGASDAPKGLYSGFETWHQVNTPALANAMRKAYNQKELWKSDTVRNLNRKYIKDNFSRSVVAEKFMEIL